MSAVPIEDDLLEMFDPEERDEEPWNEHLRDPGLHPEFSLFIANLMVGYLQCAPGRINALLSAYQTTQIESNDKRVMEMAHHAREMFLDSGGISPLIKCMKGKATAQDVRDWIGRTDLVVELAWRLHDAGSPVGVVAAMDLPAYRDMLGAAGLTVDQGMQITLENAIDMLDRELPPAWKPVFTSQGVSLEDHMRCLEGYQRIGVLDAVRSGDAWLAVGGMAFAGRSDRVHVVHRRVREVVGPEGHIHALGVTRIRTVVPMIQRGWINSADSSSPCQKIRYNLGIYHMEGPRPTFLVEALHAANSLYYEAELAIQLKKADRHPLYEQGELFDDRYDVPTRVHGNDPGRDLAVGS